MAYLLELREAHRYVTRKNMDSGIAVGDIVVVFDEKLPRGLWKLGKVEGLIPGADNMVRGGLVLLVLKFSVTTESCFS